MAPVEVLNVRPDGSVGVMDHEATAPPLAVGDRGHGDALSQRQGTWAVGDGRRCSDVDRMVTMAVALPPVLLAVTV